MASSRHRTAAHARPFKPHPPRRFAADVTIQFLHPNARCQWYLSSAVSAVVCHERAESLVNRSFGEWLATCIGKNTLVSERLQIEETDPMGPVACNLDKVSAIPALLVEHKEASLIRQILGGRRDLFGDLIEPHVGALWRTVQAKMRDDPDIDDIVQRAVFNAFTHLEQFRFEAGFRTWLIQIALNEVHQNWRKRLASRSVALDGSAITEIQVTDPRDSPYNVFARSQTARLLQIALASLPEKYQIVVRMRDLEERSISEVAETLRLTVAAVKTRHHRGRLRMAKFLSRAAICGGSRGVFNEAPKRSAAVMTIGVCSSEHSG